MSLYLTVAGDFVEVSIVEQSTDFSQFWLTPGSHTFEFQVQGCGNAGLALSMVPGNATKDAVIITFGANQNTGIQLQVHMKFTIVF